MKKLVAILALLVTVACAKPITPITPIVTAQACPSLHTVLNVSGATIGDISNFCLAMAELMKNVASARDRGVPVEKARALIRGKFAASIAPSVDCMVRAVYVTEIPPLRVSGIALDECMAGLGRKGVNSEATMR
jgi:hypothetical protein